MASIQSDIESKKIGISTYVTSFIVIALILIIGSLHAYYLQVINTPTFITNYELDNLQVMEDFLLSEIELGQITVDELHILMTEYQIDCLNNRGMLNVNRDGLTCKTRIVNSSFYGQNFYPDKILDVLASNYRGGLSRPYGFIEMYIEGDYVQIIDERVDDFIIYKRVNPEQ